MGEFTLVIEFFPPAIHEIRVNVVSTSLNIVNSQPSSFRNTADPSFTCICGMLLLPEHIFIDVRCQGANFLAQGVGHLIVSGVEGKQCDVDSGVHDTALVIENGKMNMMIPIAMSNKNK